MMAWSDSYTSSQDFRVAYAEADLYNRLGQSFSVEAKTKELDKFGYNGDLDAATLATRKTVANLQAGATANETLQTTNSITHIVGGSGDTQSVRVEGHYLDASGNLIFHVQNKTLTATTPVALDQAIARCSRMYVAQGGVPTGPIDATIGSGGTAVTRIAAGDVQTQKCASSTSYRDAFVVLNYGGASFGTGNARVQFRLEERPLFDNDGNAYTNPNWRPLTRDWLLSDGGSKEFPQETPIVIGPNTDFRVSAWSSSANSIVVAHIDGFLAINTELADAADPDPA